MDSGHSSCGWTLVELLVVVAVIAVLVGLMLPALGSARGGARGIECQSNLRQIQAGWSRQIEEQGGIIPHTTSTFKQPNWIRTLDAAYPDAPLIFGIPANHFNSCPEVRVRYGAVYYFGFRWGYSVNGWWRHGGARFNDLQPIAQIVQPSRYPFFTDPQPYPWVDGSFTTPLYLPRSADDMSYGGLGGNHGGSTAGNAAFADGGVRAVPVAEVPATATAEDRWRWFANR